MSGPLSGLRVVELAVAIQGPAAGLHFANMGAEVIKVEPPAGDASRYGKGVNNPYTLEVPGSQYIAMNKGKRSVTLDVHTPLGQDAMHRLLASADVFLTNYRASALTRMGRCAASRLTCDSSLVSLYVLIPASIRRYSSSTSATSSRPRASSSSQRSTETRVPIRSIAAPTQSASAMPGVPSTPTRPTRVAKTDLGRCPGPDPRRILLIAAISRSAPWKPG